MNLSKKIEKLCSPAYFYFLISTILFLTLLGQNIFNGKINELCAGSFTCSVSNVIVIFVFKVLYIVFWTFVLNALCDYGYKNLAWFVVLIPFILMAIILGLFILNQSVNMVM